MDDKSPDIKINKLIQLPMARVKTIMRSSPELGNVSQDAYFLVTKATELFIQYLVEETFKCTQSEKLEYKALGICTYILLLFLFLFLLIFTVYSLIHF